MTIERAIEILTPTVTRYSPTEYEEALVLAREALTYFLDVRKLRERYGNKPT